MSDHIISWELVGSPEGVSSTQYPVLPNTKRNNNSKKRKKKNTKKGNLQGNISPVKTKRGQSFHQGGGHWGGRRGAGKKGPLGNSGPNKKTIGAWGAWGGTQQKKKLVEGRVGDRTRKTSWGKGADSRFINEPTSKTERGKKLNPRGGANQSESRPGRPGGGEKKRTRGAASSYEQSGKPPKGVTKTVGKDKKIHPLLAKRLGERAG